MQSFPIQAGTFKGKKIQVPYYLKTNHGVEIKIVHKIPKSRLAEIVGKKITILVTVYWGYDRYRGGRIAVVPVQRASQQQQTEHLKVARKMFAAYQFSVAS